MTSLVRQQHRRGAAAIAAVIFFLLLLLLPYCCCDVDNVADAASSFSSSSSSGNNGKRSFQVSFPIDKHTAYAQFRETVAKRLEEFSLCLWERPFNMTKYVQDGMFSYATGQSDKELYVTLTSSYVFFYMPNNSTHAPTQVLPAESGRWVHYCFNWSFYKGSLQIYENGKKILDHTGFEVGQRVRSRGVAVLGQVQNRAAGGFLEQLSWRGDISEVHMWDRVLCPTEIAELANCTSDLAGNVFSFGISGSSILSMASSPNKTYVNVRPVTLCKPCPS